ncbi:MAG: hypothetical protein E7324_03030 [Clostridiales bacterium]|nr:hypothetical protein [Clostridiales bacterium]
MLYPHNQDDHLSRNVFRSPGSEYRGTPFWAWNCQLEEKELVWQIEQMKAMGLGGFHMHCRSGMSTEYLSDEFMDLVKACVEKARDEHMLAWLYDEDRWPSGAAGGIVTKDPQYRARYLCLTPQASDEGQLIARYAIVLDENGCLKQYKLLSDGEKAPDGALLRYAYLRLSGDDPWYNNQAYLDTLNPKAVKKFLEVTHERYAQYFEKDFGGVVPAIFTDEPQFTAKRTLTFPGENVDAILPWTDDLEETYLTAYGESLLAKLPEVLWELPDDRPSQTRYHYHDHITERFTQAFADQIGAWCEKHHIMLTGHMMEEPTLESQTRMLGEAMRSYRGFQLPGIDMLCDRREFTTAKQAQSAAHQYGRPGVLSELYGVTNWNYDFRGHKSQGDWQAALGVTVRVQHLSWVSMEGEAKRDYPACINYQSPWYKEYPYVEDYFARVNAALTRGKPHVKIGMIHPIESYWLRRGPLAQTEDRCAEMDQRFQDATAWLLHGLMDFDYICESLLPAQCKQGGFPLQVGEMAYDAVIVPQMETIRSTTLDRLENFQAAGGQLIFMGEAPKFVDAIPSDRPLLLAKKSILIPYTRYDLLRVLEPLREIDVRTWQGERAPRLLSQMRDDGNGRWLFLCNGFHPHRPDQPDEWYYTLTVNGEWVPTLYDAMTGDIRPCPCRQENGKTIIPMYWHGYDSLLLHLQPGKACVPMPEKKQLQEAARFRGQFPVTLSEPNVLLLDQAEYAFDGGAWQAKDEILRIEKNLRAQHHLTLRDGNLPQPWVVPPDTQYDHFLTLRFKVKSEIPVSGVHLALERPDLARITWNGQEIPPEPDGYFTDKSIKTVPLPEVHAGENELILHLPLGNRTGAEWCYLLGDFGVKVMGDEAVITPPVRKLGFGDWSHQGLPFYAGNVTYHLSLETDGDFTIQCPQYSNPLLAVDVDGKRAGVIAYSPYRLDIACDAGTHAIDITAFGNRCNAFAPVHCADEELTWYGPHSWRLSDSAWCNEYRLVRMGLLSSPIILK